MDLTIRPRRLRTSAKLRKMVRETRMDKSSLVYPMFVMDGENKKEEIPTMPGQFRYTLDRMPEILTGDGRCRCWQCYAVRYSGSQR